MNPLVSFGFWLAVCSDVPRSDRFPPCSRLAVSAASPCLDAAVLKKVLKLAVLELVLQASPCLELAVLKKVLKLAVLELVLQASAQTATSQSSTATLASPLLTLAEVVVEALPWA